MNSQEVDEKAGYLRARGDDSQLFGAAQTPLEKTVDTGVTQPNMGKKM